MDISHFIHIRFVNVIMSYELDIKTFHGLIIQYFVFEQKQKSAIFESTVKKTVLESLINSGFFMIKGEPSGRLMNSCLHRSV